jgi:hypothetical protein
LIEIQQALNAAAFMFLNFHLRKKREKKIGKVSAKNWIEAFFSSAHVIWARSHKSFRGCNL